MYSGALIGWRQPKLLHTLLNSSAGFAYRIPTVTSSVASAILAFPANALANDTVKVGEETYKFTGTVTNAYDVLLGASATNSATALFKALTGTGVAGVDYGLGTVANPVLDPVNTVQSTHDFGSGAVPIITAVAVDFGAAFNTTPVAESTAHARMVWLFDTVALTHVTSTLVGGTNQTSDTSITGAATWLEFVDPDTDVMKSQVVDDTFQRYYFASPSQPPQYNTAARIQASQPPWLLGIPAPGCAPGVDPTGGGSAAIIGLPTSSTASTTTPGSDTTFLLPVTPGGAMVLNDVAFMPNATSAGAKFTGVLYSDVNGAPGDLLAVGAEVVGCTAGVTVTSVFPAPFALLELVQYWIGFLGDTSVSLHEANTGTTGVTFASTYANGALAAAPPPTTGQPDWQLWGDVTTSAVLESRAYVYTWVSAYGEEGPPSPPTLADYWSNGTWTISLFTPAPDDMGVVRNITLTRIYRTITGTAGDTTFFFVAELPVATATYADISDDSVIGFNAQLPSTLWFPPPENLQSLVAMPNGMVVGFKGNEVWFCEPYRPHAWPGSYTITTEYPIVGIGVAGQTVVICTQSVPYIVTGTNPAAMSEQKLKLNEPCLSRGGILSTPDGVYYTSINGLCFVSAAGTASNTTEGWITRERWRALTPSKFTRAIRLASSYFAFGSVSGADHTQAQTGFSVELASSDGTSFTIWPQPGGHRIGFETLSAPGAFDVVNLMTDPWTGFGLTIQNSGVYYYDFQDQAPVITPYLWRSKKFQQTSKHNYAAMRVFFDIPPGSPTPGARLTPSPTFTTAVALPLGANMYGVVRVYADDVIVTERELRTSGELMRILSGFKAETWQIEVEARVSVKNVQFATSIRELGSV